MEYSNIDQLNSDFENMYLSNQDKNNDVLCKILHNKELSAEEKLRAIEEACQSDPNAVKGKDRKGNSPLLLALCTNETAILQLLLKNNAVLNERDKEKISGILESEGIYVSPKENKNHLLLWMAVWNNNSDMVSFMAKTGYINENIVDQEGNSLLYEALRLGNGPMLTTLMKQKCSLSRHERDSLEKDFSEFYVQPSLDHINSDTLLWLSVLKQDESLITYMLENGAQADIEDRDGYPLIIIASRISKKIENLILKYPTKPSVAA